MLSDFLVFILSFAVLIYSSELFVVNSVRIAGSMGVSHFIIGISIIGIGTSLPEIVVSVYASIIDDSGIALGNIIGSNITNIALILGITFFFKKIHIPESSMLKDSIIHLSVLALGTVIILSGDFISRWKGLVMIAIFAAYLMYSLISNKRSDSNDPANYVNVKTVSYTIAGLCGVLVASKYLVDSAVIIASLLNISSSAIAFTIIALGTSVPELSVSISAARKGYVMFVLGNIVGSNVTNLMLGTGLASAVREIHVEDAALIRFNLLYMILLSIILIMSLRNKCISRLWGVLFLSMYILFTVTTYRAAS